MSFRIAVLKRGEGDSDGEIISKENMWASAKQREDNEWSAERVVRQRLRRLTAQSLDNPSRKSLGAYERPSVEGRCYSAAVAATATAADDQQPTI